MYNVLLSQIAKRNFAELPDTVKKDVISEIKAMISDGIPPYAEPLERELDDLIKLRLNGWRIILSENADRILILDIRQRNRRTYLNVP